MVPSDANINVFSLLELSDEQIIIGMKSLLSAGIDINQVLGDENHQYTMMHACCFLLKDKALAWMLEQGADVNMKCSETTALGMLVQNHFSNSERDKSYWTKMRSCLTTLEKHNADFNIVNHEKKKPLFALLEHEKEKIPQEVINTFFEKTSLNEKSSLNQKKGETIIDILLKNEINFTPANVAFLVEKKGVDLNGRDEPQSSIAFSLVNIPEKIFKKVKKVLEAIHDKYGLNFNIANNLKSKKEKALPVLPIEVAISKKNFSVFKFFLEKCPELLKHKFGDLDLAQYCAMAGFKDGLKHMLTAHTFDWNGKENLLTVCSSGNHKQMIKKEHATHMYDSLSSQLTAKASQPTKRMKI